MKISLAARLYLAAGGQTSFAARGFHNLEQEFIDAQAKPGGAKPLKATLGNGGAKSLAKYTRARVLTEAGAKTAVFARFSTVAGGAGSVDTPRDVRGFAVKFYPKEGNWDLVGNNIPVSPTRTQSNSPILFMP